jgi:hypothetical protein
MKRIFLFFTASLLLAVLNVFAADNDYTVDAEGVITKYSGFDTEVVIPATIGGKKITAIGRGAFKNAELTGISIPEGITSIGIEAFAQNKLTSVTIPGSVKTIEEKAFQYNNTLTTIVLSEGVENIGISAFGNTNCQSISIPASIRNMFNLFRSNARAPVLSSVVLAANINYKFGRDISNSVFYNYIANDRRAGTYTSDMTSIEKRAGDHTYIETQYGAVLTGYRGSATRLRIPAEIEGVVVKALAFSENSYSYMVAVQIPDSITYIGEGTFGALENVDIPASITYIGQSAFSGCNLKTVTIPENVVYIGERAFSSCKLSSITFSAKSALTIIDWEAFSKNTLTSVTIPASVTYIGGSAFMDNQLTSFTIPASVTYIGSGAFSSNSIKTITIPLSVKVLGNFPIGTGLAGLSIVIGADVSVSESTDGYGYDIGNFGGDYNKNGRKAGRYTYTNNWGEISWIYSAR